MGLFGYKIPSIPTISLCLHPYSHSDFFSLLCSCQLLVCASQLFFFHFFFCFSHLLILFLLFYSIPLLFSLTFSILSIS